MTKPPKTSKGGAKPLSLSVDYDAYAHYLEDADDLTEDEKRQFIEALWTIVVCFVDLGFSVDPAREPSAEKLLEKQEQIKNTSSHPSPDMLELSLKSPAKNRLKPACSNEGQPGEGLEA